MPQETFGETKGFLTVVTSLIIPLQFEYQQAQLEAEIENLSWKIEHAETTDRGDLENQMDVAEKRR